MGCLDGLVDFLVRLWHGASLVGGNPFVHVIEVDEPALARFGSTDVSVLQLLVDGSEGYLREVGYLLGRDDTVTVLSCLLIFLILKAQQYGSLQARHFIQKLGYDLREVVECELIFNHVTARLE